MPSCLHGAGDRGRVTRVTGRRQVRWRARVIRQLRFVSAAIVFGGESARRVATDVPCFKRRFYLHTESTFASHAFAAQAFCRPPEIPFYVTLQGETKSAMKKKTV